MREEDGMAGQRGIGFIGNVIVDNVSEVLEPGNLVYSDGSRYLAGDDYESEDLRYSVGGMATNNSVNLARMGFSDPITVVGKVGIDENAGRIRDTFRAGGIPDDHLIVTPDHPTSMTQVLYVKDSNGSVNRTFRHFFGAMGSFIPDDIDYDAIAGCRIVMVGYCLLLPHFDRPDPEYGAATGRVLERLRNMGVTTCVDFVTPKRDRWWKFDRFRKMLKWVDIISIGEDQAEGITGIADEQESCRALVEDFGVKLAVVHCGDKGLNHLYSADTGLISQPIFKVPDDENAGNTGAGDAFTSGLLYGLYHGWEPSRALKYATAAAAVSLGSPTCTDAMRPAEEIVEYMETRKVIV